MCSSHIYSRFRPTQLWTWKINYFETSSLLRHPSRLLITLRTFINVFFFCVYRIVSHQVVKFTWTCYLSVMLLWNGSFFADLSPNCSLLYIVLFGKSKLMTHTETLLLDACLHNFPQSSRSLFVFYYSVISRTVLE